MAKLTVRDDVYPHCDARDAAPLRRYKRRWTVERTIAWLQHLRRLSIRWEKSTQLFNAFLHLGSTFLLLKRVLG